MVYLRVTGFSSYRRAKVGKTLVDLPRNLVEALHKELAEKAKKLGCDGNPGNHEIFTIVQSRGMEGDQTLHVWFTDDLCRIGTVLVEGSW